MFRRSKPPKNFPLDSDGLFRDPDFPASDSSIFNSRISPFLQWKRPLEMSKAPILFKRRSRRTDIIQGCLGDCWFLSACASISRDPALMARVMPSYQPLYGDEYKGIVFARFWRFGKWETIYFDDRLPTMYGRPLFAKSSDPDEYWISLLEKGYAKLNGGYGNIELGRGTDAFVDLTGGLAERYDVKNVKPEHLFKRLTKATQCGAFICGRREDYHDFARSRMSYITSTDTFHWFYDSYKSPSRPNPLKWKPTQIPARPTKSGFNYRSITGGFGYLVTGVARVNRSDSDARTSLVKLRNPFHESDDWQGSWSNGDKEHWKLVNSSTRHRMVNENEKRGDFWMTLKEFTNEFHVVVIVSTSPDKGRPDVVFPSQVRSFLHTWPRKYTGYKRHKMIATAPQYLIDLTPPSSPLPLRGSPVKQPPNCGIVLSLMQDYIHTPGRRALTPMGLALFKVEKRKAFMPATMLEALQNATNSRKRGKSIDASLIYVDDVGRLEPRYRDYVRRVDKKFLSSHKPFSDTKLRVVRELVLYADLNPDSCYVIIPYARLVSRINIKFLLRYSATAAVNIWPLTELAIADTARISDKPSIISASKESLSSSLAASGASSGLSPLSLRNSTLGSSTFVETRKFSASPELSTSRSSSVSKSGSSSTISSSSSKRQSRSSSRTSSTSPAKSTRSSSLSSTSKKRRKSRSKRRRSRRRSSRRSLKSHRRSGSRTSKSSARSASSSARGSKRSSESTLTVKTKKLASEDELLSALTSVTGTTPDKLSSKSAEDSKKTSATYFDYTAKFFSSAAEKPSEKVENTAVVVPKEANSAVSSHSATSANPPLAGKDEKLPVSGDSKKEDGSKTTIVVPPDEKVAAVDIVPKLTKKHPDGESKEDSDKETTSRGIVDNRNIEA